MVVLVCGSSGPLAGAVVDFSDFARTKIHILGGGHRSPVHTDEDGRVDLRALPVGKWRVRIRHPEYATARFDVEVRAAETTTKHVQLVDGVLLEGRILTLDGNPAAGVSVEIRTPGWDRWPVLENRSTDSGGRFHVRLHGDQTIQIAALFRVDSRYEFVNSTVRIPEFGGVGLSDLRPESAIGTIRVKGHRRGEYVLTVASFVRGRPINNPTLFQIDWGGTELKVAGFPIGAQFCFQATTRLGRDLVGQHDCRVVSTAFDVVFQHDWDCELGEFELHLGREVEAAFATDESGSIQWSTSHDQRGGRREEKVVLPRGSYRVFAYSKGMVGWEDVLVGREYRRVVVTPSVAFKSHRVRIVREDVPVAGARILLGSVGGHEWGLPGPVIGTTGVDGWAEIKLPPGTDRWCMSAVKDRRGRGVRATRETKVIHLPAK